MCIAIACACYRARKAQLFKNDLSTKEPVVVTLKKADWADKLLLVGYPWLYPIKSME